MKQHNYNPEDYVSDEELAMAQAFFGEKVTKHFVCLFAKSFSWAPYTKNVLEDGSKEYVKNEQRPLAIAKSGMDTWAKNQVQSQFINEKKAQADDEFAEMVG